MKNNPVNWFEIYVQDMQRAKTFYETVFQVGLTRLTHPDIEMWGFPMAQNTPGAGGSLVKIEGVPSGGHGTLVYFRCDDCAVEAARVADAGGKLHKAKFSIGEYGFIAMAYDTEGNLFGLHSVQ
jgi:hypothetical protein